MQRSSVSSIFPASDRYCPRHTVSVSQRDLCRLSLDTGIPVTVCHNRELKSLRSDAGAERRSGLTVAEGVKQVAKGEERETTNGAAPIQVMARAALRAPSHDWKQVQRLADVGQGDDDKASCAQNL